MKAVAQVTSYTLVTHVCILSPLCPNPIYTFLSKWCVFFSRWISFVLLKQATYQYVFLPLCVYVHC